MAYLIGFPVFLLAVAIGLATALPLLALILAALATTGLLYVLVSMVEFFWQRSAAGVPPARARLGIIEKEGRRKLTLRQPRRKG